MCHRKHAGNLAEDPAEWLREQFRHEWCAACGRDQRHHLAVPFMGNWFAKCLREPVHDGQGNVVMNPENYPE
jgi:hypothetical protein